MNKDLHQANHIVHWGISVAIVAAIAMVALVSLLDFTFLRNPHITQDWHLRIILFIVAAFLTLLICREVIRFLAWRLNKKYLSRFTEIKSLGIYKQSEAKRYNSQPKYDHAVLLLHGFTAAPQQFSALLPHLESAKIPYYAPRILGFGLNSTQLLQKVRCEDWLRTALDYFDDLAMQANHVSIVGHSMGTILATFIAEQRQVKHLVLSAPALYSMVDDLRYRKIFVSSALSNFYAWVIPFLPKSVRNNRETVCDVLDTKDAAKTFQYLSVPTHCVKEIFKMQGVVDIFKANYQTLDVLHGKYDQTVNNQKLIDQLMQHQIDFQSHYFTNSAHNIFEDYEREKVCEMVVEILNR